MQTKFFMKGCDNKKMEEMIRLQGITKKYGNNLIIPKLDLTIYDGEFLTLLGPSGCGKTTLLRMIAGLDTPTTGKIYLDDEDVTNKPPYKRDVNMVFQHYALFPHMTVEENIKFGLMMKKVPFVPDAAGGVPQPPSAADERRPAATRCHCPRFG